MSVVVMSVGEGWNSCETSVSGVWVVAVVFVESQNSTVVGVMMEGWGDPVQAEGEFA